MSWGAVAKEPRAQVEFMLRNGGRFSEYEVGACGGYLGADLCILKLPLKAPFWFRTDHPLPRPGVAVQAVGNPSSGRFSLALGKLVQPFHRGRGDEIEVTNLIRPGYSGGPLFTDDGILVGVSTETLTGGRDPTSVRVFGASVTGVETLRRRVRRFVKPWAFDWSGGQGQVGASEVTY